MVAVEVNPRRRLNVPRAARRLGGFSGSRRLSLRGAIRPRAQGATFRNSGKPAFNLMALPVRSESTLLSETH